MGKWMLKLQNKFSTKIHDTDEVILVYLIYIYRR